MPEPRIKTTIEFMPDDYERLRSYADKQDVGLASAIMGLLDTKRPREAFIPPSVEDVSAHVKDKGYTFDPEAFVAYYATRGWRINSRLMSSWKAACLTWQKHEAARARPPRLPSAVAEFNKTVQGLNAKDYLDAYRAKFGCDPEGI